LGYQDWAILSVSGAGPYSIVAKISDTVGMALALGDGADVEDAYSYIIVQLTAPLGQDFSG
jgi:hypothetical protein